jgi:hypothetical protein
VDTEGGIERNDQNKRTSLGNVEIEDKTGRKYGERELGERGL